MKIAFHGAAQTVTGSKHVITLDNGKKILLDCGMFQGMGKQTISLNNSFGFVASEIDAMILSHAHIDHTGLIPKLYKEGFRGNIFCTPATKDLAEILLADSAIIQKEDIKYTNKKRQKQGLPPVEPLYSLDEAKACMSLFVPVEYNVWFDVCNDARAMFVDAGHIIGSAIVNLKVKNKTNKHVHITFSGDVGRYRDVILRSPSTFPQADYIIMESTYGNKLHEQIENSLDILENWIKKTCLTKKGKLIIPSFSVGRTQELLYYINTLNLHNRIPNIPVYVDSPLSAEATSIVKKYPYYYNKRIQKLMQIDDDPFDFPGLKFIKSVDESKALNDNQQPCIIISASGMADAGRIKHHIINNISQQKNTILIVGYCEPHSLGAKLASHQNEVKIFGELYQVVAEVGVMKSMSAHADYDDLFQFLACQNKLSVKQIFIVHGEYNVQQEFKEKVLKKGFKDVVIPSLHSEHQIA